MMKRLILIFILCPVFIFPQSKMESDIWKPFEFFIGSWQGTGGGQPGKGFGKRTYSSVLNDQFIKIENRMTYAASDKNPDGLPSVR